jgi:hypothetical protein
MLSSGMKCYHLEQILSCGTKCYHVGRNVIMWTQMLSSGQFCAVKLPTKFHAIIWWYHVVLSCDVIMRDDNTPFSFFLETSLTRVYVKLKLANLSSLLKVCKIFLLHKKVCNMKHYLCQQELSLCWLSMRKFI